MGVLGGGLGFVFWGLGVGGLLGGMGAVCFREGCVVSDWVREEEGGVEGFRRLDR